MRKREKGEHTPVLKVSSKTLFRKGERKKGEGVCAVGFYLRTDPFSLSWVSAEGKKRGKKKSKRGPANCQERKRLPKRLFSSISLQKCEE